MEPSSSELNVLGVYQSDNDAFLGEIDSVPGEEVVGRSGLRSGKDGTNTCHGEEEEKTAGEHRKL